MRISLYKAAATLWLATSTSSLALQAQTTMAPMTFSSLQELFSTRAIPNEMRLGDMNNGWFSMKIGSGNSGGENAYSMAIFGLIAGALGNGEYYSQGQSVSINGESFLVAYRVPIDNEKLAALMDGGGRERPKPTPLTPDTRAVLSLMNLRHASALNDIQPIKLPSRAQAQQISNDDQIAQSTSNLKQLGLGVMQYVQDYDERLPPMKSVSAFKTAINPYVKSSELFLQPGTQKPYQPNAILSGKPLAHIKNPSGFVMIYETSFGKDGKRGIAFLDGHVSRVSPGEWDRLKVVSKIK